MQKIKEENGSKCAKMLFLYTPSISKYLSFLGALWQGFSKCFSIGFYRSPAKPLTKKRLPS
jgi:hypothetical protein